MSDVPDQPVVLVLDDEKNIRAAIEIALAQENIQVIAAHDVSSASRILAERLVDLAIVDIQLGEIDGLSFFKKLVDDGHRFPVVFISGHASLSEAAQAVKLGAFDFLEKPFSAEKIAATVRRGLDVSAMRERLRQIEGRTGLPDIVGESRAILSIVEEARKVAKTNASVLITGESGTGKELIANAIHQSSARSDRPLIKVNCSAIPEALVESELFGHEKGSFTGAIASKRGLFELAHRGTIFLDEVADLSLAAQAKILRVLQNGEMQRVGSERTVAVDVRIVSGTHKDLKQAVADGSFREDLYYRLNVVPIRLPSLRERTEDIPLLASAFLKRLSARDNLKEKPVDEEVFLELKRYSWPGNVRELQNVLSRMLIMSGERVTVDDLPEEILAVPDAESNGVSALKEFRDRAERDHIVNILRKNNGNITQGAAELGVRRTYLHKRMAVLKIGKKDFLI